MEDFHWRDTEMMTVEATDDEIVIISGAAKTKGPGRVVLQVGAAPLYEVLTTMIAIAISDNPDTYRRFQEQVVEVLYETLDKIEAEEEA